MSPQNRRLIYTLLNVLFVLVLFFLFSRFGIFKTYAHLFSDKHLHRNNLLFRLGFTAIFAVVNHIWLLKYFYFKKHYIQYATIVLLCLVGMLILPEFVVQQPKLDFHDTPEHGNRPPLYISPIPVPLFEMVNMILLFFACVLGSIALKTKQNTFKSVVQNSIIEPVVDDTKALPSDSALTVTVNYSLMRMEFGDILFIKSMDNYLQFYLKDRKPILVRMTLKEALDKLPKEGFVRVHKSYIVSVAAIESIRNKTILIGENEIPIGRAYEAPVFSVFNK
jgi:hypothetical protein